MLLIVIVKKKLKNCFCELLTASVGAGIMGIMVRIVFFGVLQYMLVG